MVKLPEEQGNQKSHIEGDKMGEALGKIVEEIVGICKRNNKRPKFWFSVAFFYLYFYSLDSLYRFQFLLFLKSGKEN